MQKKKMIDLLSLLYPSSAEDDSLVFANLPCLELFPPSVRILIAQILFVLDLLRWRIVRPLTRPLFQYLFCLLPNSSYPPFANWYPPYLQPHYPLRRRCLFVVWAILHYLAR